MIDPREYNEYMKNAGKSSQVPLVHYDAISGKRVRPGDALNVSRQYAFLFIAGIAGIVFIYSITEKVVSWWAL